MEKATDTFPRSYHQRKSVYDSGEMYLYLTSAEASKRSGLVKVIACSTCVNDLKGKHSLLPPRFSPRSGFDHGVSVPSELLGLTFAEEALISIFQPAMAARTLKYGMFSVHGHVTFFDRHTNVADVATRLPRLAVDIQVIELRRQSKDKQTGEAT